MKVAFNLQRLLMCPFQDDMGRGGSSYGGLAWRCSLLEA